MANQDVSTHNPVTRAMYLSVIRFIVFSSKKTFVILADNFHCFSHVNIVSRLE